MQELYTSLDGYPVGGGAIVLFISGLIIFLGATGFALFNVVKFYRHKSYALGLFYVLSIVNLILRSLYFVTCFFVEQSYFNVVFLCIPASFSASIGLC